MTLIVDGANSYGLLKKSGSWNWMRIDSLKKIFFFTISWQKLAQKRIDFHCWIKYCWISRKSTSEGPVCTLVLILDATQYCFSSAGLKEAEKNMVLSLTFLKGHATSCLSREGHGRGRCARRRLFAHHTVAVCRSPPEFLALKHKSRILGQSSNPVCG